MKTSLFDYDLPRELIATTPAARRDDSRLMVLQRAGQRIEHHTFGDILNHLRAGDLLVLNNSRVIRARIHGKRMETSGKVEFLLLERLPPAEGKDRWRVLCKPARKLKPGEVVYFSNKQLIATVLHYAGEGERDVEFSVPDVLPWLDQLGEVPLPPYIIQRRRENGIRQSPELEQQDAERYQTVYAQTPGSVAAPTAGLHFTQELLERAKSIGIDITYVTLHVGPGTFKPVEVEDVSQHVMHEEVFKISQETAEKVNAARHNGRRVVAVGTTSARSLESSAADGHLRAGSYSTSLMITPGYKFQLVDALLTNFHLPRSTLLMLVSAFAGREFILRAYAEAVALRYRFYSYGDAMLIL